MTHVLTMSELERYTTKTRPISETLEVPAIPDALFITNTKADNPIVLWYFVFLTAV